MAKRFTDTDIWDQDWFVELPSKYKLLWYYMKDKCDNVGIWRPNKVLAQRIIGEPLNLEEFLMFVNTDKERIRQLPTGRWFLKDFFVFQYGETFSPLSPVHRGALKALVANGVHPKEILAGQIENLESRDIQDIKQIAFGKDIKRLMKYFPKASDRHKDKDKE